ncbi:hypothetical protein AJ80_01447 [Polytolypa hystricis UAMH7299]|uniref:Uncharacterized protein n=1 Tax=Polytolypa hystricis (strain UAMH7299) TaxID=1447883 RepID=A0A2B7YZU3_POLH7|nr:hypothetical protein AJ80_01447 [Polytolypa hystricis UAMH7299]
MSTSGFGRKRDKRAVDREIAARPDEPEEHAGLFCLWPTNETIETKLDIVAVHGLGGHPFKHGQMAMLFGSATSSPAQYQRPAC